MVAAQDAGLQFIAQKSAQQERRTKLLAIMLAIAANAHREQYDKAGKPYFLHCLTVMQLLGTDDEELQCIALGHDLFEDTDITESDLILGGMTVRVIDGIRAMTKQRGKSYDEYRSQVKANRDAVLVKMADLTHNSDIRRIKDAGQKDFDRTVRYRAFYQELQAVAAAEIGKAMED